MSNIDEEQYKLNALLRSSCKWFNSSTISSVIVLLEQRDSIIQRWQACHSPEDTEVVISFLRTYNRDLKALLGL